MYLKQLPLLDDDAVAAFAEHCPSLTALDLSACPLLTGAAVATVGARLARLRMFNVSELFEDFDGASLGPLLANSGARGLHTISLRECFRITCLGRKPAAFDDAAALAPWASGPALAAAAALGLVPPPGPPAAAEAAASVPWAASWAAPWAGPAHQGGGHEALGSGRAAMSSSPCDDAGFFLDDGGGECGEGDGGSEAGEVMGNMGSAEDAGPCAMEGSGEGGSGEAGGEGIGEGAWPLSAATLLPRPFVPLVCLNLSGCHGLQDM